MEQYYKVLGLEPGADETAVKKAYFRLIRMYSPEEQPEKFQEIRHAYEQLKNVSAKEDGPEFPVPKEPFASNMLTQVKKLYERRGWKLLLATCEEALRHFPDEKPFIYYLAIAQRECGKTGKAVKTSERLVSMEPDNKWFQKELALSYDERGFTKKAYDTCKKAYDMGCRDLDTVVMFAGLCKAREEEEEGAEILLETLRRKEKWEKDEIAWLVKIFMFLFFLMDDTSQDVLAEVLDLFLSLGKKYRIYIAGVDGCIMDLAGMLIQAGVCADRIDIFDKIDKAYELVYRLSRSEDDRQGVRECQKKIRGRRIQADSRIIDIVAAGYDVFVDWSREDESLRRFAMLDVMLCMLNEREQVIEQIPLLQEEYADYYKEIADFLEKLQNNQDIDYYKMTLKKNYDRMYARCDGGIFYELYPEEKNTPSQRVIVTGESEQPYTRTGKKIGRNDPCPCGSGKKYKFCCMNK